MTADTGADGAQGAPDAQPQGGPPPAQGAAPPSQGDADKATDGQDREALLAKIADLERDNLGYRERERQRKADGSDDDLKTRLSELERQVQEADRQRTEAEARLQEQSLRASIESEARRLGFRNPADAHAFIDLKAIEMQDGKATNLDKLLTDLAKERDYLLQATDFGGGPRGTSPGSSGPTMNDIIRSAAGRQ